MNIWTDTPRTKGAALDSLGIEQSDIGYLQRQLGFMARPAGSRVLTAGQSMRAAVIGVEGQILLGTPDELCAELAAPFVVDFWAADEERLAVFDSRTTAPSTLLLVDWTIRQAVFEQLPSLHSLSGSSEARVADALRVCA